MFKIGEIVVCVDARRRWYKLGNLKENEMYTVVGFNPYDDGLILKETKSIRSGYNAYAKDRFRKVDYEFAEQLLNNIKEEHLQNKNSSKHSQKSK
ncbi:hypothetical protein EGM88_07880 [Aureibaculum marinum]|uniref:Uncharacterized protein n=1 Tax=Aureibaculum marinum TaxID=2487930 RepID=A0A3N4NMT4_9FLAO|nr:hypothetical protein [Aureibaculum marinum]RPD97702.1 hypothetical protein EGM88_07880 [Aureibaculum marinum]